MKIKLEIAVSTPDEALAAVRAGADRLELGAALEVGGVTPSLGMFELVRERVAVPVWILLRSRGGGFVYSADEIEAMVLDAATFLSAGAAGIVFGALDEAGNVAREPCQRLAELAEGRVAFHRAFDFAREPRAALDQLLELGFTRVLTSGGKPTACEGSAAIAEWIKQTAGRMTVMPGGGIKPDNVAQLVRATGCTEVHAAVRSAAVDATLERNRELAQAMGAPTATDAARVTALRTELDHIGGLC